MSKKKGPNVEKRVPPAALFELRGLANAVKRAENRAKSVVAELRLAEAKLEERLHAELVALELEDPAAWKVDARTGVLLKKEPSDTPRP